MSFETIKQFENAIADYFGAPYAVAVDSCTHGVELCLRYFRSPKVSCPKRTYISIPNLARKLNLPLEWRDEEWQDYYYVDENYKIADAAVLWGRDKYIPGTHMSLSFQFQKHLSLGRAGMILTDDKSVATALKKMSYDGRDPDVPWREQDINTFGCHYYMTPETAQLGLDKLQQAIETEPRQWVYTDWP